MNVQRVGRGTPKRMLHGKPRHPIGLSSAGLRPLVLIGGFLSPGDRGVLMNAIHPRKPPCFWSSPQLGISLPFLTRRRLRCPHSHRQSVPTP